MLYFLFAVVYALFRRHCASLQILKLLLSFLVRRLLIALVFTALDSGICANLRDRARCPQARFSARQVAWLGHLRYTVLIVLRLYNFLYLLRIVHIQVWRRLWLILFGIRVFQLFHLSFHNSGRCSRGFLRRWTEDIGVSRVRPARVIEQLCNLTSLLNIH